MRPSVVLTPAAVLHVLNEGSEKELAKLPGIGPGLAVRITYYRAENYRIGEPAFPDFASVRRVHGISFKTVRKWEHPEE